MKKLSQKLKLPKMILEIIVAIIAILGFLGVTSIYDILNNSNEKKNIVEKEVTKEEETNDRKNTEDKQSTQANLNSNDDSIENPKIITDTEVKRQNEIYLCDMKPFENSYLAKIHTEYYDVKGNLFKNVILHDGYPLDSNNPSEYTSFMKPKILTYQLNGEYSELIGTLAYGKDSSKNKDVYIKIYGDDHLIYKSDIFNDKSSPNKINISVKEYKLLKIMVVGTAGYVDALILGGFKLVP